MNRHVVNRNKGAVRRCKTDAFRWTELSGLVSRMARPIGATRSTLLGVIVGLRGRLCSAVCKILLGALPLLQGCQVLARLIVAQHAHLQEV